MSGVDCFVPRLRVDAMKTAYQIYGMADVRTFLEEPSRNPSQPLKLPQPPIQLVSNWRNCGSQGIHAGPLGQRVSAEGAHTADADAVEGPVGGVFVCHRKLVPSRAGAARNNRIGAGRAA
jgi:hypothetical protein